MNIKKCPVDLIVMSVNYYSWYDYHIELWDCNSSSSVSPLYIYTPAVLWFVQRHRDDNMWWLADNVTCNYTRQVDLVSSAYDPRKYQFGSDETSASFAFNWSRGRGATLTRAARRYASCVYTEQALILSDVTTKVLVTWIIVRSSSGW